MLYVTKEGGTIRNGFNFYPLSDKGSAGVRIRLGDRFMSLRYSKLGKKFFFGYHKLTRIDKEFEPF